MKHFCNAKIAKFTLICNTIFYVLQHILTAFCGALYVLQHIFAL